MRMREWILLSGTSNPELSQRISRHLNKPLADRDIRRFADGEIFVEIQENVRGRACYVIQSTCRPVNDTLMELLITIDALKRASAKEINIVAPYFGYARQDRKVLPRTPISAKLTADLLAAAGATRVLSMDLHAGQIQGFFNIPFDNLFATPVLLSYVQERILPRGEVVVVSPDAGGMERARSLGKRINAQIAMIDKRRVAPNVAKAMNIVGDVKGKIAVILDDMIDTAGTLTEAANAVRDQGAVEVFAVASHGVLSGSAIERIQSSALSEVAVTNTIPMSDEARACKKLTQLDVAPLFAEAINRIHHYDSVSNLFI